MFPYNRSSSGAAEKREWRQKGYCSALTCQIQRQMHISQNMKMLKNIRNAFDLYKDFWELFQINSQSEKARKIL